MILLSSGEVACALEQFRARREARMSLDLGLSSVHSTCRNGTAILPDGVSIPLDELQKVVDSPDVVFVANDGRVEKLVRFSDATGRVYRLLATETWPALEISGILMHPIKNTDPKADAEAKVALISPVRGTVLDTCCGLGYTAIVEAKSADSVTTVEKDPVVVELVQLNPYSQDILSNPRIGLLQGDSTELITQFPDAAFDCVNHDPPTVSVAGDLYSDHFYEQLFRVIKPGGSLLHYTGDPGGRDRRVSLLNRVARRLRRIGFEKVIENLDTRCAVAKRPRDNRTVEKGL